MYFDNFKNLKSQRHAFQYQNCLFRTKSPRTSHFTTRFSITTPSTWRCICCSRSFSSRTRPHWPTTSFQFWSQPDLLPASATPSKPKNNADYYDVNRKGDKCYINYCPIQHFTKKTNKEKSPLLVLPKTT